MAIVSQTPSISEVKLALAETSNSVGGLCTSPKINKWSKWKPVRHATRGDITLAELKNVDFGLIPPDVSTNYSTIVNKEWIYQKPTGTASSPYRLGDFRNYDNSANAIITLPDDVSFNRSSISNYIYEVAINRGGSSSTSIGIDDFSNIIGDMYVGVIVVRGGSTYIITSSSNLANSGSSITFNTATPPFNTDGSGVIYNILSTKSVPTVTLLQNVSPSPLFTSIPISDNATDMLNLTITSGIGLIFNVTRVRNTATGLYYFIEDYTGRDAIRLITQGGLFFQVDLINSSSNSIVIQKTSLTMNANPTYFGANTNFFAIDLYDGSTPINQITVPANSTQTVRMGVTYLLNRDGGTVSAPPSNAKVDSLITIRYSGINVFSGTLLFSAT